MRHKLLLSLGVCAGMLALALSCGDDGSTKPPGPCDELEEAYQNLLDATCVVWPDCSLCEPYEEGEGEQPTDEECQLVIDETNWDEILMMLLMHCEQEAGGDTDIDTDTDTDTDCDAPAGVTDWGQPCDIDTPSECGDDMYCVHFNTPPEGASETHGICTPACCNPDTPDSEYCTDVADGDEACNMLGTDEQWCGVSCVDNDDCPTDLECFPMESENYCYPAAPYTDPCDGYTGTDECCTNDNPCDWELNDICDCDSTCAWDAVDCEW